LQLVLARSAQHVADYVVGLHHEHFLVDFLRLIQLLRSTPVPVSEVDSALLRRVDELYLDYTFAGNRLLP
jgi:hypothetical protein